jgi:DNA-binding NtrC family response regulator
MYREINQLRDSFFSDRLENEAAFSEFVTCNEKMLSVFRYLEVIAPSRQPVLINGETGTGKELVARAVHKLSGCPGEYVAVNVAGLDDTMFADTLFGHRKGAFTGAEQHRDGLVARASGGTLFLDEIGDLSEQSQTKLLRLLQEREYYPVGSDTPKKSDARVVLATNHDLQQMISAGRFRRDLYYRLCTHQVSIIPLRERSDDIPLLLDHFLADAARQLRKKKPTAPRELSVLLSTYPFPGNVRELEAMVHDGVARHSGGVLSMESFSAAIGAVRGQGVDMSLPVIEGEPLHDLFGHFPNLREVEEYLIAEAMKRSKGNQGIAASMLGITRQTLNKRLQSLPPHS